MTTLRICNLFDIIKHHKWKNCVRAMITMKNHSVTEHQKKLLQLLFQSHVNISIVAEVSLIQDLVSPVKVTFHLLLQLSVNVTCLISSLNTDSHHLFATVVAVIITLLIPENTVFKTISMQIDSCACRLPYSKSREAYVPALFCQDGGHVERRMQSG